jgi:acyl carrier protein
VSAREHANGAWVEERLRAFVARDILLDPNVRIDERTPLLRGLIDSTGLMELLSFVEDEFGVQIVHTDIDEENFGSIDRIARFVARSGG